MAINLASITRGRRLRPPRIVLIGREKVGKSTFAAGAPNTIFIPVKGEEGIDGLDVARFPVAMNYQGVIDAIASLCNEDHDFQTIAIDSISTLESLIMAEARRIEGVDNDAKLGGGYGNQDNTPGKLWAKLCDGLDHARQQKNMASILIGHAEVTNAREPDAEAFDQFNLSLRKKARATIFRWADAILFATRQTSTIKEDAGFNKKRVRAIGSDARVLRTQARPTHPGGGRGVYGHLPYELPLDWPSYQAAITEANLAAGGDTETDSRSEPTTKEEPATTDTKAA